MKVLDFSSPLNNNPEVISDPESERMRFLRQPGPSLHFTRLYGKPSGEKFMSVDIQHLFNIDLPASIAAHPDTAKQIGGTIQFNILGDGGGQWSIVASGDHPSCIPGAGNGSDVTITMAAEDFQKYYQNPQSNSMQLLFAGKIKITGNQALFINSSKLFQLGS